MDEPNTARMPVTPLGPVFFNALCWVRQTTFPEDLERGMLELGASPETARAIHEAYTLSRPCNIIKFYEDYAYAGSNREWQGLLAAFIERGIAIYMQRFAPPTTPAGSAITEGCRVRVTRPGPTEGREGVATWDSGASKWEVRFDQAWCGWYEDRWLEVVPPAAE